MRESDSRTSSRDRFPQCRRKSNGPPKSASSRSAGKKLERRGEPSAVARQESKPPKLRTASKGQCTFGPQSEVSFVDPHYWPALVAVGAPRPAHRLYQLIM